MDKIKVSVIIPVYNVELYIDECIESLLRQSLDEIEFIFVDDGSTDKSVQKIKEYKDNRIKILYKQNGGQSSARNLGIKHARGEFITFIDSDDFLIIDECYEKMYELAINSKSDIVCGNGIKFFGNGNKSELYRNKNEFYERTMDSKEYLYVFRKNNSMHSVVWLNLYSRSFILDNELFFEEGYLHEDELFIARAFLVANTVTIYPKNYYGYRIRSKSTITSVSNIEKRRNDLKYICNELLIIYSNVDDKNLKKELMKHLSGLILTLILVYGENNIGLKLKGVLLKYSNGIKSRIVNICVSIFPQIYRKIKFIS